MNKKESSGESNKGRGNGPKRPVNSLRETFRCPTIKGNEKNLDPFPSRRIDTKEDRNLELNRAAILFQWKSCAGSWQSQKETFKKLVLPSGGKGESKATKTRRREMLQ